MRGSLRLEFEGEVVESREMLDGTRHVVLRGRAARAADGPWALTLTLSWTMGKPRVEEGELALSREDGSEMYGALGSGRYGEGGGGGVEGAAETFDVTFDIDGGEGEFASAGGTARLTGTVSEERFAAAAEVRIE